MPQGKLRMEPVIPIEKKLAEKTFGKNSIVSNLTDLTVSFPLIIFCNNIRDQDFLGDAINGFSMKFCNQFSPAPTDVGMCLSKNMNVKEILSVGKDYETYMNTEYFDSDSSLKMGSFWARSTYVLNAAAFNSLKICDFIKAKCSMSHESHILTRSRNKKDFNILMQIHQNKTLGHMLDDKDLNSKIKTISLQPGYEYTIVVSPSGQESTNGFKQLSLEQRSCRLDHEVQEGSHFKVYSKNNCLYECYVAEAYKKCQCIPWDFIHGFKESEECDIFGRTCFTNVFEDLMLYSENLCLHCIDECDVVEFNRNVLTKEKLEQSDSIKLFSCSNYLCYR